MREFIKEELKKSISEDVPIEVTIPEHEEQGHYATAAAFALGKLRGVPPLTVARDIASKLAKNTELFSHVEVAGPGFVNVWLAPGVIQSEVSKILAAGLHYGRAEAASGKKVQVEFISANPTGPLTLANGRGGFLGDVIGNVLEAAGHLVEREYYVNDTGNQVITFGKSLLAAAGKIPDEETFYKGEYIKVWAASHPDLVEFYKDDPHALGRVAAKEFLDVIKSVVEGKASILFDRYTSELDDVRAKGYVEKVLELFKSKNVVYEADGAVWLKTTDFGDDKDRVLVTTAGEPTYLLADAGHYLETVERGFAGKVLILGPDHYGYVARIQAAAKLVGLKDSTVIITQAVRLIRGGEEMKMSKRKGVFVTFDELVEEIPPDAARFFFLMVAADSHLDFDLALAKEASMKNPVYYAQYAYVRTVNILEKAGRTAGNADLSLLGTPVDLRLIRALADLPEVVRETARDYQVQRLTRYASMLARAFHEWYEKERVVGEEPALMDARLALVSATKTVFENLFLLLGISAPEKM